MSRGMVRAEISSRGHDVPILELALRRSFENRAIVGFCKWKDGAALLFGRISAISKAQITLDIWTSGTRFLSGQRPDKSRCRQSRDASR